MRGSPVFENYFFKGPCPIPLKDRLLQYSSRLLGVPRMRILRVTNQSCPIAGEFKDAIKVRLITIKGANLCAFAPPDFLDSNIL